MEFQLDSTDKVILSHLIQNARTPYLEIARECGISGAAIHQRVKKLEKTGIISGSRIIVKPKSLGLNVCAFVSVKLTQAHKSDEVIEQLMQIEEISECHFITGNYNLLLKVYCLNNEHLMEVIAKKIQNIPSVVETSTLIALGQTIDRASYVPDCSFSTKFAETRKRKTKSKKSN